MAYMHCHNCGNKVPVNTTKIRVIGILIAAFGVFGWFSFLFAGSGHAFLISCCIFFGGLGVAKFAEDIGKSILKDKPCPQCGIADLHEQEKSLPFPRMERVIDISELEADNHAVVEEDANVKRCPRCKKGTLKLRHGRYGPFMGCSRFPDCRYTEDAK